MTPLTIGVACFALGLLAGYSTPRREAPSAGEAQTDDASLIAEPGKFATRPSAHGRPKTDSAFKFPESTASPKQKTAATIAQSGPPATDHEARMEWLQKLPAADLPRLVTELCQSAGPDGLGSDDRRLLSGALDRWWQEDGAGLLSWLRQLPSGRSKHYLVERLLQRIAFKDPAQAAALAESFKAADPEWDNAKLQDSLVEREVNQAWQTPGVTAEERLALHSRFSRGNKGSGPHMKTYPQNFDFRKFLDGMVALNQRDGKNPAQMPSDVLEAWARIEPQAAAEWLLRYESTEEKDGRIPFAGWDDISRGVTARSGLQAYHQWAAGIVVQGSGELRDLILRQSRDPQLAGIVGQITDAATRDSVLAKAIATSDFFNERDNLGRLGLVSTPEMRLRIIVENADRFQSLIERGKTDPSFWSRIGLTTEQVASALDPNN